MNQPEIGKQLHRKRHKGGLSIRALTELTGLAPSTISRIERGLPMDFDNFVRVNQWLGNQTTAMVKATPSVIAYEPDILAAICRHIRGDQNLTPENAETLCRIMTTAYEGVTRIASARGALKDAAIKLTERQASDGAGSSEQLP